MQFVAREIRSRLPSNKTLSIVDLGIGNGRLIFALKLPYNTYIGLDISDQQLLFAKERFKLSGMSGTFRKHDLEYGIPLEDCSIDAVISNASIHHVKNKGKLISEIFRVLKKGGQLIFFDFYFGVIDSDYISRTAEFCARNPDDSKKFIRSIKKEHSLMPRFLEKMHPEEFHISPNKLISLMESAGFKNCEIIPTFYNKCLGIGGIK
jgi:ubiquinone/menaquinone biosynthesis C-methylase UbiE